MILCSLECVAQNRKGLAIFPYPRCYGCATGDARLCTTDWPQKSLVFCWVLFHFLLLWLMTSVFVGKLLIVLLGAKKKEPTEKRQM